MDHKTRLARAAVGVLAGLSVLTFAPAAAANDAATDPDLGLARNGIDAPAADLGRARNDIGDLAPAPADVPLPVDTGLDASDVVLGGLGGLLVVAGGAGIVITMRRRDAMAHHPA